MASRPVYLDYNATTPLAPEVLQAMLPYLATHFGNPSSSHGYGRAAAAAILRAREEVAQLIASATDEVVFTGCATEANNLAILGVARAAPEHKRHVVVSAIEHPAVLAPAGELARQGWRVTELPVDTFGRVDPAELERVLRPDTALVSVMLANNEIGTLQPIAELAQLTRKRGILLHTDAAQAAGKLPIDVRALGVDLLTLAGHKFYAPKGVGALYVRRGTPIAACCFGAEQERHLRPGTENVAAIVGLGAAARLTLDRQDESARHLHALRERLHAALSAGVPGLMLNGHPQWRLPNTLHCSFPGVRASALLEAVAQDVAASRGSACHEAGDSVSGVLAALGVEAARAAAAVRLSVGWPTTAAEIDRAAAALIAAWGALRKL